MAKITLKEAQLKLKKIIAFCQAGADYDECKKIAQPYLDVINEGAKVLAKKHGKKYKPFTFTYLFR